MKAPPPVTLAELTALYRQLEHALGLLPESPPPSLVFRYADEANHLAKLLHAALAQPALRATEAELDQLHAAMSEASLLLHRRFPQLPPRES